RTVGDYQNLVKVPQCMARHLCRGRLNEAVVPAAQIIVAGLRPNGTVKLSGVQGSRAELGRGLYSEADGPELGRARSLPSGVRPIERSRTTKPIRCVDSRKLAKGARPRAGED